MVYWILSNLFLPFLILIIQTRLEKYRQLLNENPVVVRRLSNKMVASYKYFSGNFKQIEIKTLIFIR